MEDDGTGDGQKRQTAWPDSGFRWIVVATMFLSVAIFALHSQSSLNRRLSLLEETVITMQDDLAAGRYTNRAHRLKRQQQQEQPLRNERDVIAGQCLCPPGTSSMCFYLFVVE